MTDDQAEKIIVKLDYIIRMLQNGLPDRLVDERSLLDECVHVWDPTDSTAGGVSCIKCGIWASYFTAGIYGSELQRLARP